MKYVIFSGLLAISMSASSQDLTVQKPFKVEIMKDGNISEWSHVVSPMAAAKVTSTTDSGSTTIVLASNNAGSQLLFESEEFGNCEKMSKESSFSCTTDTGALVRVTFD